MSWIIQLRAAKINDIDFTMKHRIFSTALAVALFVLNPVSAGNNDGPPGTSAQHVTYDCGGDPMGCQNMCYYYYCLGRSNYMYVQGKEWSLPLHSLTTVEPILGPQSVTQRPRQRSKAIVRPVVTDGKSLASIEVTSLASTNFRTRIKRLMNTRQRRRQKVAKVLPS